MKFLMLSHKKQRPIGLLILDFFALTFAVLYFANGHALAADCSSGWEVFSSQPYQQLAMPDTNVKYWRYRFRVKGQQQFYLKVSGHFPHGRYMNFSTYDQRTLNSTGSLSDFIIKPDPGFANPFAEPLTPSIGEQKYRIALAQKGAPQPLWSNGNTMEMPTPRDADEERAVELWYRIYLPAPERQQAPTKSQNIRLPRIESVDKNQNGVDCPAGIKILPKLWGALKNMPPSDVEGQIVFYAPSAQRLYSNPDTQYLAAPLDFKKGELAIIRFRAPKTFTSARTDDRSTKKTEARYWSVCISGLDTRTSECLADQNATLDQYGFINLVIGPESLRSQIQTMGLNFLAKGRFMTPLVIYRNLLPEDGYAGNFKLIPTMVRDSPEIDLYFRMQAAKNYIGDYAPSGQICNQVEFFLNYCEMNLTSY